jgi:hypothetical protein
MDSISVGVALSKLPTISLESFLLVFFIFFFFSWLATYNYLDKYVTTGWRKIFSVPDFFLFS